MGACSPHAASPLTDQYKFSAPTAWVFSKTLPSSGAELIRRNEAVLANKLLILGRRANVSHNPLTPERARELAAELVVNDVFLSVYGVDTPSEVCRPRCPAARRWPESR